MLILPKKTTLRFSVTHMLKLMSTYNKFVLFWTWVRFHGCQSYAFPVRKTLAHMMCKNHSITDIFTSYETDMDQNTLGSQWLNPFFLLNIQSDKIFLPLVTIYTYGLLFIKFDYSSTCYFDSS